jgi:hypothetical protein
VKAGRTRRGTRYRPSRKRRASTALFTVLAALIAATCLVALGARAVVAHMSCTNHPVIAHVAVSAEIEPAVAQVGQLFNRQHHSVNGRCAKVEVATAPAATVAAELAGRPSGAGTGASTTGAAGASSPGAGGAGLVRADAWVPDSQLWVDLARGTATGAARVRPTGAVLAQTPLVIAMPRAAAARTPAFASSVSWQFLFPQSVGGPARGLDLNVQFPDPNQSAAGLATLVQVRKMFGYGRPARFNLARFAFNVQVVPPADGAVTSAPLTAMTRAIGNGASAPVTVTSEQAVVLFDRTSPQQPLAVRYPSGGTATLTYPYVLTSTDTDTVAAARVFGHMLGSQYARAYLRYDGFRMADGSGGPWPAAYGLDRAMPRSLPVPGPAKAAASLRAWQLLSLGQRLIALNDVSAAMSVRPVPGGPTLEQVLGHAAALGLDRFPESTQMGLWVFASHLQGAQPYKQLVPLGPLPGPFGLVTRRQMIEDLAGSGTTVKTGAALYSTILAAYKQANAAYQPHYVNGIIVLTAGVEDAHGDISAKALLPQLAALYNRARPVNITVIMIGQAGKFSTMNKIARTTGGKAYDITDPAQIKTVFYHAMGRLICKPHCPGPSHHG